MSLKVIFSWFKLHFNPKILLSAPQKNNKKNLKLPTFAQTQQILNLVAECIEQNVLLKNQIADLVRVTQNQHNVGEETRASIGLLFDKTIELEQALVTAGINIPQINKVIN